MTLLAYKEGIFLDNHYALFMMEEGIIHYKAGNIEHALQCWQEAAAFGSAGAMFNLGVFWLQNASSKQELMTAKNWFEKAASAGHKNADIQIEKTDTLLKTGIFQKKKIVSDSVSNLLSYKKIRFGGYSWLIMEETEEAFFCLTEHLIAVRAYHEVEEAVTWKYCSLRKWLNTDFFDSLQPSERLLISERKLLNQDNCFYKTSGGDETNDRIFLLSYSEMRQYLSFGKELSVSEQNTDLTKVQKDDFLRKAFLSLPPKRIAEANVQFQHDYSLLNGQALGWWLRSPGSSPSRAMRVNCHGTVRTYGREVNRSLVGVRPAAWINKEKKHE